MCHDEAHRAAAAAAAEACCAKLQRKSLNQGLKKTCTVRQNQNPRVHLDLKTHYTQDLTLLFL